MNRRPWLLKVAAIVGLVAVLIAVWWLVEGVTRAHITQPQATAIAGVVAGIGAAAATITGWRQIAASQASTAEQMRHNERMASTQRLADSLRSRRERFSRATEQLGASSITLQTAGVFSLASLADEWLLHPLSPEDAPQGKGEAQLCIDMICAHIRTFAPPKAGHESFERTRSLEAIFAVIGGHLRRPEAPTSWSAMKFDFANSHISGTHDFSEVFVHKQGMIIFDRCTFESKTTVSFNGVTIQADGGLAGTGSSLSFREIRAAEGVCFDLCRAQLESASIDFSFAHLMAGSQVAFNAAELKESEVFIDRLRADNARVSFYYAKLNRSVIHAAAIAANRGELSFEGVTGTNDSIVRLQESRTRRTRVVTPRGDPGNLEFDAEGVSGARYAEKQLGDAILATPWRERISVAKSFGRHRY